MDEDLMGSGTQWQEQAMQIQKNRHPEKIFTFDYDHFVNAPELNLRNHCEYKALGLPTSLAASTTA